jgi:hypothetical protein
LKKFAPFTLGLILIAAACIFESYQVRETARGVAVWSQSQAYVFVFTRRFGHHAPYVELPFEILKSFFGAVTGHEDHNESLVVLSVNEAKSEVHRVKPDPTFVDFITPLDGRVYARGLGPLCRWMDTHFEPATEAEKARLANRLTRESIPFQQDGWSRREIPIGEDMNLVMAEGRRLLITSNLTTPLNRGHVKVTLVRKDREPETLLSVDTRQGFVGGSWYRTTLR